MRPGQTNVIGTTPEPLLAPSNYPARKNSRTDSATRLSHKDRRLGSGSLYHLDDAPELEHNPLASYPIDFRCSELEKLAAAMMDLGPWMFSSQVS